MSNAVLRTKKATSQGSAAVRGKKMDATQCTIACCEIRMEECCDGCKIYCICDDATACAALQKLCRNLDCGACSVQCTRDGQACCECCFDCCDCTCEMLADGVCICCNASDDACLKMVQAMCRCMCCCCECGCDCTVCINGMPICQCAC
jgi:hypothetical protein